MSNILFGVAITSWIVAFFLAINTHELTNSWEQRMVVKFAALFFVICGLWFIVWSSTYA